MMASAKARKVHGVTDDGRGSLAAKRRRKVSASEDDDSKDPNATPKHYASPPMSKIYNSATRNKPAELFRKDLISAMKLPDGEQLDPEIFWFVSDTWKQEWERGVQVPVNPSSIPKPSFRICKKKEKGSCFKLPKKLIRCTHDSFFSNDLHVLTNVTAQAEKVCRYDMDDLDVQWLNILNEERSVLGIPPVEETTVELVIEELETQCSDHFQEALKTQEGLGIEYDEDVICDVCRSPDSEEGNEMVFCDSCNICVHQACYGITTIPEGSWVCRTCALSIHPPCILCPNQGGAMKSTRSGQKWAHVSCALWIPEVSIGCAEKMEPITKISQIPASRWALICTLCRERVGACIQCSVKQCKTAYHVTCAFRDGLDMKAIFDEENEEDGVRLRSYCIKHGQKEQALSSDSESENNHKKRNKKMKKEQKEAELSNEERANARLQKIQKMKSEFHKYVNLKNAVKILQVDPDVIDFIYQYWKLKRKAKYNQALLTPKTEESDILGKHQEDSLYARMKMFVHLRQDLERVRNLCYMVSRREKLFRSWFKLKEDIFYKQSSLLSDSFSQLNEEDIEVVLQASHGDTIYDHMYSWKEPLPPLSFSPLHSTETTKLEEASTVGNTKKVDRTSQRLPNPYAKQYHIGIHTRSRRRSSPHYTDVDSSDSTHNKMHKSSKSNICAQNSAVKCLRRKKLEEHKISDVSAPITRTDNCRINSEIDIPLTYKNELDKYGKDEQIFIENDIKVQTKECCCPEKTEVTFDCMKFCRTCTHCHGSQPSAQQKSVTEKTLVSNTENCPSPSNSCDKSTHNFEISQKRRNSFYSPPDSPPQASLITKERPSETSEMDQDSIFVKEQASEKINNEKAVEKEILSKSFPDIEKSIHHSQNKLLEIVKDDVANNNSPLFIVTDSNAKETSGYSSDGCQDSKCSNEWDTIKQEVVNDDDQSQSPRLVIRLRKDPEYKRWQRESDFTSSTEAFRVVQNDWEPRTVKSERNLRSDKQSHPAIHQTRSQPSDSESKENGPRYSMRNRSSQKPSKRDFGVS